MNTIGRKKFNSDTVFNIVVYTIAISLAALWLYPLIYVVSASFSTPESLLSGEVVLLPKSFNFSAYKYIFQDSGILTGYRNTIFYSVVGTVYNMLLTICAAYPLSRPDLKGRGGLTLMMTFTMFFGGGMIPTYLNIRDLGLYNSLWALILPGMISVYNSIICRTAIEGVPESLKESAYIDGANDIIIVFRIILPLIMPTIAVLLLYYGVGHWNAWFNASIYLQDNELLPIQNIMRSILIANSNILNAAAAENDQTNQFAESIKYATIILTTVPVLCIYPFLQKYFVKGVMVGAVKG